MDRTTIVLSFGVLLFSAGAMAQQSSPQTPEDAYSSRELIAWSQLQTPQPAPQPLPPKEKQIPQPEQPADQQPTSPAGPNGAQQPIVSYTGTVLKQSGGYFLVIAGRGVYRLQRADELGTYENRSVTISGYFRPEAQVIRVEKIDFAR